MSGPICVSVLAALLALTVPTSAQQDAGPKVAKHSARITRPGAPETSGQGGYMGYCGQWFRCYTGIPLQCGDNTRPFQDIANHACFCVHDGCPQQ